jgi:uncharacterized protein (TIRG00374 family)
MDKKQKKGLWISIGLSIVILLVVMILTFNENTIESLKNLNPWFLFLAFSLHMIAMCIWALHIQIMCESLGYPVTLRHCLNMNLCRTTVRIDDTIASRRRTGAHS